MEKKNVNLNNEENKNEQEKEKLFTKVKNTTMKIWKSKPAKVVRAIGRVALVAAGSVGTVYLGTRLGAHDGFVDLVKTIEENESPSSKSEDIPFVEENKSETEVTE